MLFGDANDRLQALLKALQAKQKPNGSKGRCGKHIAFFLISRSGTVPPTDED